MHKKIRLCAKQLQNLIHSSSIDLKKIISEEVNICKVNQQKLLIDLTQFYENKVQQERGIYMEEIDELKIEISRQYKVISLMKKEVEDLMDLVQLQHLSF